MYTMLASVGAVLFYSPGFVAQWRRISGQEIRRDWVLLLTAVGALFHTGALYLSIHAGEGSRSVSEMDDNLTKPSLQTRKLHIM